MFNNRYLFLLSCLSLGAFQSCSIPVNRGAATPEELVSTYLRALENKDTQTILKLIPKDYDGEKYVEEKISRFGSRKLEQRKITYEDLQKPNSLKVTIEGVYYDKPFPNGRKLRSEDKLFIHAGGNRWYLLLGDKKG